MGERSYKRSWKNLLINKQLQLSFTLFMVGLAAVLMGGFAVFIVHEANEATTLARTSVMGDPCPDIVAFDKPATPAAGAADPATASATDAPGSAGSAAGSTPAAGSGAGSSAPAAGSASHHATVVVTESEMTLVPAPPPAQPTVRADLYAQISDHWACTLKKSSALDRLDVARLRILLVFVGASIVLLGGLAIYSILMTHKVAGPLFKVTLYLHKMREGRFDKVWNLRKGDQLVDFYEHFKAAHAGIVTLETDDITRLKATIAAAEASGLGEHAAVVQLRAVLARKEKALA